MHLVWYLRLLSLDCNTLPMFFMSHTNTWRPQTNSTFFQSFLELRNKSNSDERNPEGRGDKKGVCFIHSFFYQLSYQRRRFVLQKSGGVKTFLISKCFFYPSSSVHHKSHHRAMIRKYSFVSSLDAKVNKYYCIRWGSK